MASLGTFLYYTVVSGLTGGFLQASARLLPRSGAGGRAAGALFWVGMCAFWAAAAFLGLALVFLIALPGGLFHWYPTT